MKMSRDEDKIRIGIAWDALSPNSRRAYKWTPGCMLYLNLFHTIRYKCLFRCVTRAISLRVCCVLLLYFCFFADGLRLCVSCISAIQVA